ncbi:reverse transcriptase domain-containing protein [Tanacetum coccineum]
MEKLVLSLVFAAKRLQRTTTKMERHAGRTQYHLPVKDVGEKTDPGGLPCKEAGQKSARHISCRNPFTASNNEAEYEALIAGLRIAAQMGVRNVQVLVEILKEKSIQEKEVEAILEEERPTWMTPIIEIIEYLKDGTLPGDRKEASKLPDYVIREIHEGSCRMHAGPRSVVTKAMRLGYYWPTMHRDARDMIRARIDIAGPFPEGPGKVKFLIVAMDYFTKWIEAKVVATVNDQVKKFVWDNIVCRFGLPREIVSDNGKQFSDNPFKEWCEKLNITQRFASVKHPQSNGLVERVNRSLEKRKRAAIYEAKAKLKMTKYYNARVRGVTFRPGDFVYRSNDASHVVAGGKLGPKWEGPYEVTEALGDGAYRLRSIDGAVLPRT